MSSDAAAYRPSTEDLLIRDLAGKVTYVPTMTVDGMVHVPEFIAEYAFKTDRHPDACKVMFRGKAFQREWISLGELGESVMLCLPGSEGTGTAERTRKQSKHSLKLKDDTGDFYVEVPIAEGDSIVPNDIFNAAVRAGHLNAVYVDTKLFFQDATGGMRTVRLYGNFVPVSISPIAETAHLVIPTERVDIVFEDGRSNVSITVKCVSSKRARGSDLYSALHKKVAQEGRLKSLKKDFETIPNNNGVVDFNEIGTALMFEAGSFAYFMKNNGHTHVTAFVPVDAISADNTVSGATLYTSLNELGFRNFVLLRLGEPVKAGDIIHLSDLLMKYVTILERATPGGQRVRSARSRSRSKPKPKRKAKGKRSRSRSKPKSHSKRRR